MSKFWTCKEDVIRDLIQLNSFGTMNENESRANLTDEHLDSAKETAEFLDPRTGKIIENDKESPKNSAHGRGRGRILEDYKNCTELRQQLRMVRPIGLGNDMIVSYIENKNFNENELEDEQNENNTCGKNIVAAVQHKPERIHKSEE